MAFQALNCKLHALFITGPPEIKIHNHDNYRAPLEGADLSINATITSDLPFTDYGCPTWIDIPPRWNEIFDCTHSTKPAFVGLEIHNFSYSNDAGNYTITAGNGCGNSFKYILIGMEGMYLYFSILYICVHNILNNCKLYSCTFQGCIDHNLQ